jgi:putative FmdB family regulatory protein
MPIYEYQCQECQHELEALQRVSDAPLSDCPECGRPALRKLISAPGFRLKGSGWYETDFKTGNKKNLHGDTEPKKTDSSKEAKAGEKKADAQPAKTDSPKSSKTDSGKGAA